MSHQSSKCLRKYSELAFKLNTACCLIVSRLFLVKRNLESLEGGFFEFFGFGNIPLSTIVYAVIFFILGYFLYATLAAFLGSLVSRIEDVQQMITPMTLLVVAGFMIAMFGLRQAGFTVYYDYILYTVLYTNDYVFAGRNADYSSLGGLFRNC